MARAASYGDANKELGNALKFCRKNHFQEETLDLYLNMKTMFFASPEIIIGLEFLSRYQRDRQTQLKSIMEFSREMVYPICLFLVYIRHRNFFENQWIGGLNSKFVVKPRILTVCRRSLSPRQP